MTGLVMSLLWLVVAGIGLVSIALLERRGRLAGRADRRDLQPPRSLWGNQPAFPPGRFVAVRALASFARLVRGQGEVVGHRRLLRTIARSLSTVALAASIALLPLVTALPGYEADALLVLHSSQGMASLALLLLLVAFARITTGLAERSPWARLESARQSSRALAAMALLVLVVVPIAMDAGSLALHEIVSDQQEPMRAVAWLIGLLGIDPASPLARFSLPSWNLFTQPLTALLYAAALSLWIVTPDVDEAGSGVVGVAGLGLDGDPMDAYWSRIDAGLTRVLGAGLFVTLFLGAGAIPLFDAGAMAELARPFFGEGLPQLVFVGLQVGCFATKLVLVLAIGLRFGQALAESRGDRSLRLVTRRLVPVAWANVLLVAGLLLWAERLAPSVTS